MKDGEFLLSHQVTRVWLHHDLGAVLLCNPVGLPAPVADLDGPAVDHHAPPHLAAGKNLEKVM